MTTIALLGDSTFQTIYLNTATNSTLVPYHGFAPGSDRRLNVMLAEEMAARGHTVTVTNYSLGGWDTTEALTVDQTYLSGISQTQVEACLASNPDMVVIAYGFNDRSASMPIGTFTANMQAIIDTFLAEGIAVVLADQSRQQYGATLGPLATAVNETLAPYLAVLHSLAASNGLPIAHVYDRFAALQAGGTWDLFGHNDTTWWASWENGTSAPAEAFYANVHQWTEGTSVMADEIAKTITESTPMFGGTLFDYDVRLLSRFDYDVLLTAASARRRRRRHLSDTFAPM